LVAKSNVNVWQLPDARRLRAGITNFLHAIGNYGPNRDLSVAELKSDAWRAVAQETFDGIFKDSRLDVAQTTSLTIVPDHVLWYLPFEALIPKGGKGDKTLADRFPIRYGPTAALAMSKGRPLRRSQHTGIVSGEMKFAGEAVEREKLLQELAGAVPGPLVLPETMPQPARLMSPLLDGLIALDDVSSEVIGDASSLLPRSRSASKEKGNSWNGLPYGGPERIAITGYKTELQGPKSPRRETGRASAGRRPSAAPGDEVFQSLCNLMAGGARTVLLSRWRTSGRTNFDLVREYFKESAETPAAEAWQRAGLLARENPIDQTHEPRLKRSEDTGETPTADHPFFWAGYLVVDTSPRPEKPEVVEPAKAEPPKTESPKSAAPKNDAAEEKSLPPPGKPVDEASY
jgi:hypothetical protein